LLVGLVSASLETLLKQTYRIIGNKLVAEPLLQSYLHCSELFLLFLLN